MFLISLTNLSYSQTQNEKLSAVGISIPIIWNNSEGTYYSLGNRREPNGKGTSYGINLNYSRTIYKNIFGTVGVGYFNQVFGIKRPFDFTSPNGTQPLVQTESYLYNNLHLIVGIGYQMKLNKTLLINGVVTYNIYNSYRQKYNQGYIPNYSQINHKSLAIGNIVNLNIGLEKQLSKKLSVGIDLLLPISTHWNNDEIFYKYDYSNDTQQIGRNRFSIGTIISCKYHF